MMRTAASGSRCDLIDVKRSHLRFHHELIGARHDLHDGFAVVDHVAHGVHGQLVDGARLRRAQVDALELVLGRRDPSFTIKWQNEPKFNFKQSHICFSRNPCRFRDPVALAFVGRMPDARSVRASATRGGRE